MTIPLYDYIKKITGHRVVSHFVIEDDVRFDYMKCMKQDLAHSAVDELLRSGFITFKETIRPAFRDILISAEFYVLVNGEKLQKAICDLARENEELKSEVERLRSKTTCSVSDGLEG